jgi:acetylornithine deacetylase
MREIKALASGQLEFRITIRGRLPDTTEPGHTAFSHRAVNPIDKAVKLHGALMSLAASRAERIVHPLLHAAVERSTNIHVSNIACGSMQQYSRLQEYCQLGGAVSFPPGETYAQVQAEIESVITACAQQDDWLRDHLPVVEWLTGVTGAEVPASHPLYMTTAAAVQRVTGTEPYVNAMHTSSDIRNPAVEKGIPTVGLGCLGGDLTQNGKHDEWINVPDFLQMVDVTAAIVTDWCSEPGPVSSGFTQ